MEIPRKGQTLHALDLDHLIPPKIHLKSASSFLLILGKESIIWKHKTFTQLAPSILIAWTLSQNYFHPNSIRFSTSTILTCPTSSMTYTTNFSTYTSCSLWAQAKKKMTISAHEVKLVNVHVLLNLKLLVLTTSIPGFPRSWPSNIQC